jgi:hypothetical protein
MVGRMGGQSVVIRAEKGKVKMLVDGKDQQPEKELVYDARKDIKDESIQTSSQNIRPATENNGRAIDLDGTAHDSTNLSGDGDQPDAFGPVAESGHRGDAQGSGSDEKRSSATAQDPLPPLNHRLTRLIEKKLAGANRKLEKRLKAVQNTKQASAT